MHSITGMKLVWNPKISLKDLVKVNDEIELQKSLLNQEKNIVAGNVETPPSGSEMIITLRSYQRIYD